MASIHTHYKIILMIAVLIIVPILFSVLATHYESCKWFWRNCTIVTTPDEEQIISSKPDNYKIIVISSTEGWQDTGIVLDKGDYLSISASGIIVLSSERKANPDGEINPPEYVTTVFAELTKMGFCSYLICGRDIRAHILVGRVGTSSLSDYTSGFQVGSDLNMYVDKPGHLYLGFNDGFVKADRSGFDSGSVGDNSGEFNVEITIAKNT